MKGKQYILAMAIVSLFLAAISCSSGETVSSDTTQTPHVIVVTVTENVSEDGSAKTLEPIETATATATSPPRKTPSVFPHKTWTPSSNEIWSPEMMRWPSHDVEISDIAQALNRNGYNFKTDSVGDYYHDFGGLDATLYLIGPHDETDPSDPLDEIMIMWSENAELSEPVANGIAEFLVGFGLPISILDEMEALAIDSILSGDDMGYTEHKGYRIGFLYYLETMGWTIRPR